MDFSAPHDQGSKVITATVFVLFAVTAIALHNILMLALIALLLVATYAWSPTGYAITEGTVVVKRLMGNVRISLDEVRDVRAANAHDLSGAIRLFASGGLFGHFGIFRTSGLGRCTWYVTDRNRAVVLVTKSGTMLFSPDDVAGFIAYSQSRLANSSLNDRRLVRTRSASASSSSLPPAPGSGVATSSLDRRVPAAEM